MAWPKKRLYNIHVESKWPSQKRLYNKESKWPAKKEIIQYRRQYRTLWPGQKRLYNTEDDTELFGVVKIACL